MKNVTYKICNNCVMDTSDPNITFSVDGTCDYCQNFENNIKPSWVKSFSCTNQLNTLTDAIKSAGKGKDFDCIIGLSGGLDSSYLAYVASEFMGLRPLLLHVDAGWNTDRAVSNIEALVDGLNLDLYTEVVDWNSIKRMQLAFLKSGIADQDLVQDAVFFSCLYAFARKYRVKHILTGSNFSTECCREPEEWGGYLGIDKTLFFDIWQRYGDGHHIGDFPLIDIIRYKVLYQKFLGMRVHHPLNLLRYVKKDAEKELKQMFGWKPFKHKHHESRFTRFFEDYWLPQRFGFDKRRAHFSSLIMTDQMSRKSALKRLENPELDSEELCSEFSYVAKKLGIAPSELKYYQNLPIQTFSDFKNKRNLIQLGAKIMFKLGPEKRYFN